MIFVNGQSSSMGRQLRLQLDAGDDGGASASLRPGRQQAPMTVWSKSRKDPRQLPRYAP